MTPIVFMPGFDGDASLREPFVRVLGLRHEVHAISYPSRCLGSIEGYRDHAMACVPVDCRPVLVAESFSSLVAAHWAAVDPRVRGIVLCGGFARNPVGWAARAGALLPAVVRHAPSLWSPLARVSGDAARVQWSRGFGNTMARLPSAVIAERLRLIGQENTAGTLRTLCVPILVVQFEGDQVIGAGARDHLEAVCHNAQVLRLPGPHFAIEVRPQECAEAIGGRIRELFPKGA
jgi:pimeloyl-ACP methyl ester carboxylesterase